MIKIKAFVLSELMVSIAILMLLSLILALTFPTVAFIISRNENKYKAILISDKILQNFKKININRKYILNNENKFLNYLNNLFPTNKPNFILDKSSTEDNIIIYSNNLKSNKTTFKITININKYKNISDPYLNKITIIVKWRNYRSKKDSEFKISTIIYTLH